jgi:hypothetical protein
MSTKNIRGGSGDGIDAGAFPEEALAGLSLASVANTRNVSQPHLVVEDKTSILLRLKETRDGL